MANEKNLIRLIQEESGNLTLLDGTQIEGEKRIGRPRVGSILIKEGNPSGEKSLIRKIKLEMDKVLSIDSHLSNSEPAEGYANEGNAYSHSKAIKIYERLSKSDSPEERVLHHYYAFGFQIYKIPDKYLQGNK